MAKLRFNHGHAGRAARAACAGVALLLSSCAWLRPAGNMGGPDPAERAARIANEKKGDFFYGRRYFVNYARFWGYLRKPGEPASKARLVVFNEKHKHSPDRFPEDGPPGERYGFDQNYEYRVRGRFTGREVYDNYTNQILPEFMLLGYERVDTRPGWLFSPRDFYNPYEFTLRP